jgi:hypothetical protein
LVQWRKFVREKDPINTVVSQAFGVDGVYLVIREDIYVTPFLIGLVARVRADRELLLVISSLNSVGGRRELFLRFHIAKRTHVAAVLFITHRPSAITQHWSPISIDLNLTPRYFLLIRIVVGVRMMSLRILLEGNFLQTHRTEEPIFTSFDFLKFER